MATALYEQGSYEEAIKLYEKAQKLEDEAGSSESRAATENAIFSCRRKITVKREARKHFSDSPTFPETLQL
eukprot:tig00020563_g11323.t1